MALELIARPRASATTGSSTAAPYGAQEANAAARHSHASCTRAGAPSEAEPPPDAQPLQSPPAMLPLMHAHSAGAACVAHTLARVLGGGNESVDEWGDRRVTYEK